MSDIRLASRAALKPPPPRLSTDTPPAELADQFALSEIEDGLIQAEARADAPAAEHYRQAWLWLATSDMGLFQRSLEQRLEPLQREREWSTWRDEGAVSWRLCVEWHDGERSKLMTWWLREGELGYELMVDERDALTPTPFARRTARVLPHSRHGLKQAERLILTAIG